MERKIKFRAWVADKDPNGERKMVSVHYMRLWSDGRNDRITDMENKEKFKDDLYKIHLMQFTGLLDKKGVEIYEGDIIEWIDHSGVSEVRWKDDGWVVGTGTSLKSMLDVFEIIGNKFENPELL